MRQQPLTASATFYLCTRRVHEVERLNTSYATSMLQPSKVYRTRCIKVNSVYIHAACQFTLSPLTPLFKRKPELI